MAAEAEAPYYKLQSSNGNYTIEALGTTVRSTELFNYFLSCLTSLGSGGLTNPDIASFQHTCDVTPTMWIL